MSYASKTAAGKKVDLSEGYSAKVRALRADEEDATQAIYMSTRKTIKANQKVVDKVSTTSVDLELDNPAYIRAVVLRGIVSWDLDGDPGDDMDEGGLLKVTEANLGKLTGGDRNKLFNEIIELTKPPEEDEKKD